MYHQNSKSPRDPYADSNGNVKPDREFPTREVPVVWEREKRFTVRQWGTDKYEVTIRATNGIAMDIYAPTAQMAIDAADETVRLWNERNKEIASDQHS